MLKSIRLFARESARGRLDGLVPSSPVGLPLQRLAGLKKQ